MIKFIKKVLLVTKRLLKDEKTMNYNLKQGMTVYYAGGIQHPRWEDYQKYTVEDYTYSYCCAACIKVTDVAKTPNFHNVRVSVHVMPIASLITEEQYQQKKDWARDRKSKIVVNGHKDYSGGFRCNTCGGTSLTSNQCENIVCPDNRL